MKKVFLLFVMGITIGSLLYCVYKMNSNNLAGNSDTEQVPTITTRYPVCEGTIQHSFQLKAKVISNREDIYVEKIQVPSDQKLTLTQGDKVSPGDVICVNEREKIFADCNGIVERISTGKEGLYEIDIINYDKLYLTVELPKDLFTKVDYETEIVLDTAEGSKKTSFSYIRHEEENGYYYAEIKMPYEMFPGEECMVTVLTDLQEKGLYVPFEAVYYDGTEYYATVQDGEERKRVLLSCGQRFEIIENGNAFSYIEVYSGVSSGDILLVEKVDDSGEKIKEQLLNE